MLGVMKHATVLEVHNVTPQLDTVQMDVHHPGVDQCVKV